jgi:hypothetical protein
MLIKYDWSIAVLVFLACVLSLYYWLLAPDWSTKKVGGHEGATKRQADTELDHGTEDCPVCGKAFPKFEVKDGLTTGPISRPLETHFLRFLEERPLNLDDPHLAVFSSHLPHPLGLLACHCSVQRCLQRNPEFEGKACVQQWLDHTRDGQDGWGGHKSLLEAVAQEVCEVEVTKRDGLAADYVGMFGGHTPEENLVGLLSMPGGGDDAPAWHEGEGCASEEDEDEGNDDDDDDDDDEEEFDEGEGDYEEDVDVQEQLERLQGFRDIFGQLNTTEQVSRQ